MNHSSYYPSGQVGSGKGPEIERDHRAGTSQNGRVMGRRLWDQVGHNHLASAPRDEEQL